MRLSLAVALVTLPAATLHAEPKRHLASEVSPHLIERAADPVEWYPWGEEAFERARKDHRPVLLCIGRWGSHGVRAAESEIFGDSETAEFFNRDFVNVKVDRDERPDVAEAYATSLLVMKEAVVADPHRPLVLVLTPEARPFFGAVLRPGVQWSLLHLGAEYRERRGELETKAGFEAAALREAQKGEGSRASLTEAAVDKALRGLRESFDSQHGGFGGAPKPLPHGALRLLLEEHARTGNEEALRLATRTLDSLALGAVRDHLGGGFHQGAMDREWRLPRFEKRLGDNALLLRAYVRTHAITASASYRDVAEGIAGWALREMLDAFGGFRFALDAGGFYFWERDDIVSALGPERSAAFFKAYRLDPPGVLSALAPPSRETALPRRLLLEKRSKRAHALADERLFAGANGLMIGALAVSGSVLDRPEDTAAARRAARAVLGRLGPPSTLKRYAMGAEARGSAVLADYAYLAEGLLDLHDATRENEWRAAAAALADAAVARFLDPAGGFFTTDASHDLALVRLKDGYDGEWPSPNGVMASVLARLEPLTGDKRYGTLARQTVEAFLGDVQRAPRGLETVAAAAGELLGKPVSPQSSESPRPAREVRGPVSLEVSLVPSRVRPGQALEAQARIATSAGWSLISHRLAKDLVPTTVSVLSSDVVASLPRYPEGSRTKARWSPEPVGVYTGDVTISIPLRVPPDTAAGTRTVRFRIRYQPCDARDCGAPESVVLEAPLTVTSPR